VDAAAPRDAVEPRPERSLRGVEGVAVEALEDVHDDFVAQVLARVLVRLQLGDAVVEEGTIALHEDRYRLVPLGPLAVAQAGYQVLIVQRIQPPVRAAGRGGSAARRTCTRVGAYSLPRPIARDRDWHPRLLHPGVRIPAFPEGIAIFSIPG